jgi:hypothetical protein
VGVVRGPVQLEASTFHGREPDEGRWNINRGKPDSFAARITIAPHKTLSGQFSAGRINEPESTDPRLDIVRMTASVHYNRQLSWGHIASSFIWGRNKNVKNGSLRIFNSYNLEVTARFLKHNWLWTRLEDVDRDQSLLPVLRQSNQPGCLLCGAVGSGISVLDDSGTGTPDDSGTGTPFNHVVLGPDGTAVMIEEIPIGRVKNYTVGYERELPVGLKSLNFGVGLQASLYGLPPILKGVYGNRPATIAVFLRLRPAGNMQEHMKLMHQ